jgi:glycosyltransferase involved in cell wall biosynthesis
MEKHPWVIIAGGFHRKGGMDKANLALAEFLIEERVPVHLVTHSVEEALMGNPLVKIHLVPRPGDSIFLGGPILDFRGRQIARRVTSRWSDSKIVANGGSCVWPGINWAHYIHNAWRPQRQGKSLLKDRTKAMVHAFDRNREKAAFRKARLILANSEVTRQHILQYFSVEPDRVKTLYLGSDPEWGPVGWDERKWAREALKIPPSRYTAVFVGAIGGDQRKGMDTLFEAWKLLSQDPAWDVDLLVAGSGRDLPGWQARVAEWGMQERIRMLGFWSDVRGLLAAADLLISPTRYEAYGLNVQEAICRGVPSIVSASAGMAERYPDPLSSFLLRDPTSAHELVQTLRMWRANVELWSHRFSPFGSFLRSHSWRAMAQELVSVVTTARYGDVLPQAMAAIESQ